MTCDLKRVWQGMWVVLFALGGAAVGHAEPGMAATPATATQTPSGETPAQAASEPSEQARTLIAAVEKKYASIQSIQANFVQTARSDVFGDETTRGVLIVKRPAKMRWSFGDDKLFVTNGTKLWIYTAADKQVIEYDDISAGRSTADNILSSLDKLTDVFHIEVKSSDATQSTLVLTPVKSAQFKRIELTLSADLTPIRILMTDTFNQVTELGFSDVKFNPTLDDSLFEFAPPAGVDVVKAATN